MGGRRDSDWAGYDNAAKGKNDVKGREGKHRAERVYYVKGRGGVVCRDRLSSVQGQGGGGRG